MHDIIPRMDPARDMSGFESAPPWSANDEKFSRPVLTLGISSSASVIELGLHVVGTTQVPPVFSIAASPSWTAYCLY
jgi:hypothetical protein